MLVLLDILLFLMSGPLPILKMMLPSYCSKQLVFGLCLLHGLPLSVNPLFIIDFIFILMQRIIFTAQLLIFKNSDK